MARRDYLNDPNAPVATRLVPAASAIILNEEGNILLHRRTDNQLWALPGGTMEIGESIGQTVVREVKEETGLDVEPEYVVGIYTDPKHLIAFSDGEVRQECSICFCCRLLGGTKQLSEESSQVAFVSPEEIEHLPMHPSIRLRLQHYREQRPQTVFS